MSILDFETKPQGENGHLLFEKQENVVSLTITNPTKANALDRSILADFHRCLDIIDADPAIRCVILTGHGKHFSSGATLDDLAPKPKESSKSKESSHADAKEASYTVAEMLDVLFHPVLRRLYDLDIPLITAINGPAAGIGYSFALMGDVILMSVSSCLYPSFSRIGLAPDGGATAMTLRRAGQAHAFEILALPAKIDCAIAVEKGLVTHMCADETLMDDSMILAKRLVGQPRAVLRRIKKTLQTAYQDSYHQQLEHERISQKHLAQNADFQEGIQAFLEKRPPRFNS